MVRPVRQAQGKQSFPREDSGQAPRVVRNLAKECNDLVGKKVLLKGWVERTRTHGKVAFFDFRDRSGITQVTAHEDLAPKIAELSLQDVVEVEGEVRSRDEKYINPEIETGKIEVHLEKLTIISKAAEMPFDMGGKELNLELPTLLDFRALTLRHSKIAPIFKVQEVVIDSFRKSLKNKDFTEFQAPVIIPQTAEGGSEVFEVKYFGEKAFLAQSPQFYKQILVGVYERVFTVNKTLRAEPSVTTRHITESVTLDAEMGFIDSWTEIMDEVEYVIKHIFKRVEEECESALKLHGVTVPKVPASIPRIKMRDAQEIIYKRTGVDHRKEPDMAPDDEREICKWSLEEHGSELVFVTHYPTKKRPFYTMPDPEDPEHTLSFDLIGRGVEWLTGGQRLNDLNQLTKNANKRGVDLRKSELYLQAFRYGMPPEGGWSFGSERITQGILGLANIREATLFPRDMERVDVRLSTLK